MDVMNGGDKIKHFVPKTLGREGKGLEVKPEFLPIVLFFQKEVAEWQHTLNIKETSREPGEGEMPHVDEVTRARADAQMLQDLINDGFSEAAAKEELKDINDTMSGPLVATGEELAIDMRLVAEKRMMIRQLAEGNLSPLIAYFEQKISDQEYIKDLPYNEGRANPAMDAKMAKYKTFLDILKAQAKK